jgi:hypothetical protein
VCGVVYQNKHRHLACQFTFACDNIADVVREPDMWDRAQKIAKAMLDGQLWLPEVDKSTHYHAYWVRPSWVSEMKKMYKFGVHTFYRPRAWGDGSEAPSWGTTGADRGNLGQARRSRQELGRNVRYHGAALAQQYPPKLVLGLRSFRAHLPIAHREAQRCIAAARLAAIWRLGFPC